MTSRIWDVVSRRYEQFGFPLVRDEQIIPDDDTTLFVCSGMQRVKNRFRQPDGSKHGSLQSCIRTNDLELVGDGTHLSYFEMLGNFSFGGNDYENSVELWHSVVRDLKIDIDCVHVHPTRNDHKELWHKRGYSTVDDLECVWSDGDIGGHCCELYSRGIEIGNLVNPLNHSTDVGFGYERLHLIVEGVNRVDETSLFNRSYHPVVRDHSRTLDMLWRNNIEPGNKRRNYVCRRLTRRLLKHLQGGEHFTFDQWVEQERMLHERQLKKVQRLWPRNRDKSPSWWWETHGILPEELPNE